MTLQIPVSHLPSAMWVLSHSTEKITLWHHITLLFAFSFSFTLLLMLHLWNFGCGIMLHDSILFLFIWESLRPAVTERLSGVSDNLEFMLGASTSWHTRYSTFSVVKWVPHVNLLISILTYGAHSSSQIAALLKLTLLVTVWVSGILMYMAACYEDVTGFFLHLSRQFCLYP